MKLYHKRICWTRRGLRLFDKEVGEYCRDGYRLIDEKFHPLLLRFLAVAVLERESTYTKI